jgi:hypothetical protein
MRRTAFLLALVLACASLSACGKGGYAGTAPHAPAATSTSGKVNQPSTKAQALTFARAVNLTAADAPGFIATPKQHSTSASERRLEQELRRCTGAHEPKLLGSRNGVLEASSPDFELEHGILDLSVSSEVSVAQSAAQAAGALPAIHSMSVRACVSRYLTQLLKSQHTGGATVTGVSIASGTPPAPGTSGGFGWRITAKLAYRGIRLNFYLDILGFIDGPAQVTLTSSGALQPFPARVEEELFSLLLARAKAHSP